MFRQHLVRLSFVLHIGFPILWFLLEGISASQFTPSYSYRQNFVSDLGIPYPFVDSAHNGQTSLSQLAALQNANFIVCGILYATAQLIYLYSIEAPGTKRKSKVRSILRSIRSVCSLLLVTGLFMVGLVHGGSREVANGSFVVHGIGAAFAIFGGNLNSILAGFSPIHNSKLGSQWLYRSLSVLIGIVGIIFFFVTITHSTSVDVGIYERISIYAIFAWSFITGLWIFLGKKVLEVGEQFGRERQGLTSQQQPGSGL